jgi:hypothetical protein
MMDELEALKKKMAKMEEQKEGEKKKYEFQIKRIGIIKNFIILIISKVSK